jgi:outer membrane immunogenic protein
VNGGVAFAHARASGGYGGFSASGSQDIPGGILGGQLGYNWQVGNFVYGLEDDISTQAKNAMSFYAPPQFARALT